MAIEVLFKCGWAWSLTRSWLQLTYVINYHKLSINRLGVLIVFEHFGGVLIEEGESVKRGMNKFLKYDKIFCGDKMCISDFFIKYIVFFINS